MARTTPPQKSANLQVQVAVAAGVAVAVLLAALFAFYRWEQFLIRDGRFVAGGDTSPVVEIQGVSNASERAIQSVFAEDFGRSIYLLPLSNRRDTLRSIDWVRDAAVGRVWPNRVLVQVHERTPVAFLMPVASRSPRLIDNEGVTMQPVKGQHYPLPVLKGIRPQDTLADRREKVQRMTQLLRDVGDAAGKVSEVDASDRGNLKLTQSWDGRSVTLLMGDQNYAQRYRTFLNYAASIRKEMPNASVLDLRLENKIVGSEE